jgi:Zn ribbon nucleic-acid-binding protein
MPGAWSVGAPVRPPPVPPAPAAQVVRCPQCQADEVRVRTSKAGVSHLECPACHHTWKDARRLVRVLVADRP